MFRRFSRQYGAAAHLVAVVIVLVLLLSAEAQTKIVKQAMPSGTRILLYCWPELPELEGWKQDMGSSKHDNINALAPDGLKFATAESVIYARAINKSGIRDLHTLEMFIENDIREFSKSSGGYSVAEDKAISTADGKTFRSVTFFPHDKGNWEKVSYGEEGDFYLVFTLSTRSREEYSKYLPDYMRLVQRYSEAGETPGAGQGK